MSRQEKEEEELRGLVGGSAIGAAASIPLGYMADTVGAVGFYPIEGLVRYIAGNSDTLGELAQTIKRKRQGKSTKVAWNYVRGELIGTLAGPILLIVFHTISPLLNWNLYGPIGVIIAGAFAHSDNLGGMVADFKRRAKSSGFKQGFQSFTKSYYMQGNAIFILISVSISFFVRTQGFEPRENFLAGIEGTLMGFSDSIGAGLYAILMYKLAKRRANQLKTS